MIEVRDLTKDYGDFQAVKGVSFSVQKGEILGFLGPNGAGKSTVMKILTCYLPGSSGSARRWLERTIRAAFSSGRKDQMEPSSCR